MSSGSADSATEQPSELSLAEGDAYYSTVIPVPVDGLWKMIKNFNSIGSWAAPLVEACLIENDMEPTTIGSKRRARLRNADAVIREQLLAHHSSKYKHFMTFSYLDSESEFAKRLLEAEKVQPGGVGHSVLHMSMETQDESPFPTRVNELITTLSLSPLSTDENKCFVEMHCSFTVPTDNLLPPEMAEFHPAEKEEIVRRLGIKEAERLSAFLLEEWLRPQLVCMSNSSLTLTFPVSSGFDIAYRSEYETYDEFLVQLSLDTKVDQRVKVQVENMLNSWTLLTREVHSLRGVIETLTEELAAARHITNAANNLVAASSKAEAMYDTSPPQQASASPSQGEPPAQPVQTESQEAAAAAPPPPAPVPAPPAETAATATRTVGSETNGPYRDTLRKFDPSILTRALNPSAALATMSSSKRSGQVPIQPLTERNVSDTAYIHYLFTLLDVEGKGYFTMDEFQELWLRTHVGEPTLEPYLGTPRKGTSAVGNADEKRMESRYGPLASPGQTTYSAPMMTWLRKYGQKSMHQKVTYGEYVVPYDSFSLFLLHALKS